MTPEHIEAAAQRQALAVVGYCHTEPENGLGEGTVALLGPAEPGFWATVTRAPEFTDGDPDPMDRWSTRVITDLAQQLGAEPLFPFGQPARPFITWALRSGRAWVSPVGLLVHDRAGLMLSFRGALLLPRMKDLPDAGTRPCDSCETAPCRTACPVDALSASAYDLAACHGFLDRPEGQDCMTTGCAARRACPVSRTYPRNPAQSAFHMAAFHPGRSQG